MSDNDDTDNGGLSTLYNWQIQNVIPHFTGALSMFGSAWIMVEVLMDRGKRRMAYHRLLFALSLVDFFSSTFFFASKWASNAGGGWGAPDTDDRHTSCDASGFFIYLGSMTIPPYNAALLIYYYLSVCFSWDEEEIKKRFERYIHIVIISFGITMALIPQFLGLYNPWYFYCFPFGLNDSKGQVTLADSFLILFFVVVITCSIVMLYCFFSIVCTLRKATAPESRSCCCCGCCTCSCLVRFCRKNSSSSHECIEEHRNGRREKRLKEQQRARVLMTMPFLYMIPFTLTWLVPTLIFMLNLLQVKFEVHTLSLRASFIGVIYIAIALPLQGFINWVVYMYRRGEEKFSRLNSCSLIGVLKASAELFLRILNLRGMENDNDCILGSALEYTILDGVDSDDDDDDDDDGSCELYETRPEGTLSDNFVDEDNLNDTEEANYDVESLDSKDGEDCSGRLT